MGFCSMFCCYRKRKEKTWRGRIFSLKELHAATHNFNYDNTLGEGSFGSVYWGQLWDGSEIAVKKMKLTSNQVQVEFCVEVEILGRIRHKNIITLRGFCAEGQERLIVYDYMPNLSLHSHLHGQYIGDSLLDWKRRMKIAIGIAEGIAYLHHKAKPHIIHRDIKASSVLLDSDFQAKLAGFGFAMLIPDGETRIKNRPKGSLGYLAPEYARFGQVSTRCDVYSFGILLLELVSGKRPVDKVGATVKSVITDWALPLVLANKFDEIADKRLNGEYAKEELKRVVLISLTCSQIQPEKRPTVLEVVDLLKGVSKEKLSEVDLVEMLKENQAAYAQDTLSSPKNNSELSSEDKDIIWETTEDTDSDN